MAKKKRESDRPEANRISDPIPAPGIGSRIEAVADRYGSRMSAASYCGISTDTLRRWTKEDVVPSFDAMARLAHGVGVSMDWLATGKGPMLAGTPPAIGTEERRHGAGPVGPSISRDIIRAVVEALEELIAERYASLSPANKAELIALVCEVVAEQEAEDAAAGRETDVSAAIGGAVRVALRGR